MADLSPAAQAVLDAAENAYLRNDNEFYNVVNNVAAAALRALADHVVPASLEKEFHERNSSLTLQKAVEIRTEILAIATELENYQ